MKPDTARPSRFPFVFETLVWVGYVGNYKYNSYLEQAAQRQRPEQANFPYPQLIFFAFVATLYVVPYYRWLLPTVLKRRRYAVPLAAGAVLYLWWGIKVATTLTAGAFQFLAVPPVLTSVYQEWYQLGIALLPTPKAGPYLSLLLTDVLAFSCVGFVRVAFDQETRRRQVEYDLLTLQLDQLKAQMQPHFLFNTLNSIYSLSLVGSPDTPRFILLLSELMRYVLYDSGKDLIALPEEITFLEHYFELEQRKYVGASIKFTASGSELGRLRVPPLLLLPLVENSFKHGRHHFTDAASVVATLTAAPGGLVQFIIENDRLPESPPTPQRRSGGIGLQNLRQRLALYYPGRHTLQFTEQAGRYRAELTLHL